MLRNRKIAVFIDVDNTEMDFAQYQNALQQIVSMGEIVCATVYGASERKQKGVIDDAKQKGYAIQLPSRTRRRVRKVFDDRIWVDVTDLVAHNANVDTIAIVAYPTDMVYLFSYLRRLGFLVVGTDELDQASLALVSEVVTIPTQETDLPKVKKKSLSKEQVKSETAEKSEETAELLREIDKLRDGIDFVGDDVTAETAAESAQPTSQEVFDIGPEESTSDLIGKIEEISKNSENDSDDDLVAEIKKLLDGLD